MTSNPPVLSLPPVPPSGGLVVAGIAIPGLYASMGEEAAVRVAEFFAAQIRNPNTRRAYMRAVNHFSDFCTDRQIANLSLVQPLHVAAWIETLGKTHSKPTVKQHLAAVRMLFDWLVVGQVVRMNPASSVRGPKHSVKRGKTPVLDAGEARRLLDSIEGNTLIGLRDRALIATMAFTFARIGAVVQMQGGDYFYQGHRAWVRLHEKGGKEHEMPVHHVLHDYLEAYVAASGVNKDDKGYLFRSAAGRTGKLTESPMSQSDAWAMIQRRALKAGLRTRVCNHTFRATGITEYLKNGGKLEIAQRMAGHESARTTGLYDRRPDLVALDEIERIHI